MDFLVYFLDLLFTAFVIVIVARFILTLAGVNPYHPILIILHQITEPVLRPFRGIIPPVGNFDFSPIILFVLFRIVITVLSSLA